MRRDDWAVCPTCLDETEPENLCGCDNPDTGPLCVGRCCEYWHETRSAA